MVAHWSKLGISAYATLVCVGMLSVGGCNDEIPTDLPEDRRSNSGNPPILMSGGSGTGGTSHYVKPVGGVDTGTGATPEIAWTLQHAFSGGGGWLTGGDTVWMLGGPQPYRGPFTVYVDSIVFKQFPGEVAIVDAPITGGFTDAADSGAQAATILNVLPQARNNEFWDFEIRNSSTQHRVVCCYTHHWSPTGIWNQAPHSRFVNLLIHDVGAGILNEGSAAGDVIISGNIIYNIGWDDSTSVPQSLRRGHGHGLYLKNTTNDSVVASENILFNGYGYGFHVYTDNGALNNIKLRGNVAFNNGSLSRWGTYANLGNLGTPIASNMVIQRNMLYFSTNAQLNQNQQYSITAGRNLAYGTATNSTTDRNYVVGGSPPIDSGSGWTINDSSAAAPWAGLRVIVRRTKLDPNRAIVVVYNGGLANTAVVDLDTLLALDDSFVVSNAFDFRRLVTWGRYGGAINLTLDIVDPILPAGSSPPRLPVKTGRSFNAFVVTRVPAPPSLPPAYLEGPNDVNWSANCSNRYSAWLGTGDPGTVVSWASDGTITMTSENHAWITFTAPGGGHWVEATLDNGQKPGQSSIIASSSGEWCHYPDP